MKEAYGKDEEVTMGIHRLPKGNGPLPDFSVELLRGRASRCAAKSLLI
jgi:hypothetical protein